MKGAIASCVFSLYSKETSFDIMKKFLAFRKENQPFLTKNAGCIFKNPKKCSAGYLIEQCGLKGKRHGGARISEKHANFIINEYRAKACDILSLIFLVQKQVWEKFQIRLELELQYVEKK